MSEGVLLISFFSIPLYAYGALLAAACFTGVLTLSWSMRAAYPSAAERPSALSVSLVVLPSALAGARLAYCLANASAILTDTGLSILWKPWFGGYALAGAVLGGMLGGWLYARHARLSIQKLLNVCAPSAALVLALARLSECVTDQGLGDTLAGGGWFFPLGVQNVYGEYQLPVFFYEALAALAVAAWGFARLRNADGKNAALFSLAWLCAAQLLLESLREDDFIRFGFVRFNQLCSAAGLLAVLLRLIRRSARSAAFKALRIAGLLLGLAVVTGLEFALDKSAVSNALLYAIMLLTVLFLGIWVTASGNTPRTKG